MDVEDVKWRQSSKKLVRSTIRTIKLMEEFENSYVLVGFQEGSVTKSQVKSGRRKEAGKSMPQIAADNEYRH